MMHNGLVPQSVSRRGPNLFEKTAVGQTTDGGFFCFIIMNSRAALVRSIEACVTCELCQVASDTIDYRRPSP
jgi:hypothetical protein